MSESQAGATCPVKNIGMNTPDSPALTHFRLLDECQDGARPVFRNTEADVNYWVFTDNSVILYGLPFRLEELYRDAKILEIFEGANEVLRWVIARQLIGRDVTG